MGLLIRDTKIEILLYFINLENSNFFADKSKRQMSEVAAVISNQLGYTPLFVTTQCSELVKDGLLTREYELSTKRNDKYVSFLHFLGKNKVLLKQLFEKEDLFLYINKEFYLIILE